MLETQTQAETEERRRYFIDASWYEENNLAFAETLQAAMCSICRAKLGTEVAERTPVYDKKTRRMVYEVQRVAFGSSPVKVIRDHCSKQKNFITPDLPTAEAIFRILLANGNQPMPLDHVQEQLAEFCPSGGCQWLLLPVEVLERLVQHDTYYGIRAHQVPLAE